MRRKTLLTEVGEFGLIDRLAAAWERGRRKKPLPERAPGDGVRAAPGAGKPVLRLGIGDDAAAVEIPAGKTLIATTDMLVEGVHFLWSESRVRVLGRKALAANISDIAAMGGVPGWALTSVGIPPRAAVEEVEDLYAGMGEMAALYGVDLAGGDTVSSDNWIISITLLGMVQGEPITRAGGRPGDLIMVTGWVGDSAAGLHLIQNPGAGRDTLLPEDHSYLLSRHLDPQPRVEEALALAGHGGVTAMIDVSDGVASEIHHICRRSGCGARIDPGSLPISPQVLKLSSAVERPAAHWALYGGEDYELLFTAPPDAAPSLVRTVMERTGTRVSVIGRLTGAREGIAAEVPGGGGRTEPLPAKGYNHFGQAGRF